MMLVLVTNDNGPDWLIKVNTTQDPTQARWDAYCYCYEDESPQQTTVDNYTRIPQITELNHPSQCFREQS